MTNFEKIKQMSVEEMADYIYTEKIGCEFCIRRKLSCTGLEGDCKENIRKWFESEVEEYD